MGNETKVNTTPSEAASKQDRVVIIGKNYFGSYRYTRCACRGAVIQGGTILLSYETKTDLWMIPGGGIEEGESDKDCVIRELSEETGYLVEPIKRAFTIEEYYEDVRYVTYYFVCNIVGETQRKLTKREIEGDLQPRFLPLKEAVSIFSEHEKYASAWEEKRGLYLREYTAMTKMLANGDIPAE